MPDETEILQQLLLKKGPGDGVQAKKPRLGSVPGPLVKTRVSLLNK